MDSAAGPSFGTRRRLLRAAWLVLALALLGSGGLSLLRERQAATSAAITIERADLRPLGARLLLDARADIQLPLAVRDGLDSGVPLEFLVELTLHEPRRLWLDRPLVDAAWRYRLVYYELTRHYRLAAEPVDAASGAAAIPPRNYRSLFAALEGLGRLRDLELGSDAREAIAAEVAPLRASLRVRLDTGALPLPLQPLLGTTWRVGSAPFDWTVQPPAQLPDPGADPVPPAGQLGSRRPPALRTVSVTGRERP